uniref:Uncharacterized protein n=1 Tax=Pristionchus pacificus TaxID=54126 RepID=A0A2A6CJG8_PRIPA
MGPSQGGMKRRKKKEEGGREEELRRRNEGGMERLIAGEEAQARSTDEGKSNSQQKTEEKQPKYCIRPTSIT